MRYLTMVEVLSIYQRIMQASGGLNGLRDQGGLESALAQPRMTFGGEELYTFASRKSSSTWLCHYSKSPIYRWQQTCGHAAMEIFLILNGYEIDASADEQEQVILEVASSAKSRQEFIEWLQLHLITYEPKV